MEVLNSGAVCGRRKSWVLGMDRVCHDVSVVAFGQDVVFPRPPDSPVGIADVSRIRLVHDLVRVVAGAIITTAPDHVHDDAGVLVWGVVKRPLRVDLVVTCRQRVLVEVIDAGNTRASVYTPVAEIPVVRTGRVIRVEAGVITHRLNADVGDAVVVLVPTVGDLAVGAACGGHRHDRDEHEANDGQDDAKTSHCCTSPYRT